MFIFVRKEELKFIKLGFNKLDSELYYKPVYSEYQYISFVLDFIVTITSENIRRVNYSHYLIGDFYVDKIEKIKESEYWYNLDFCKNVPNTDLVYIKITDLHSLSQIVEEKPHIIQFIEQNDALCLIALNIDNSVFKHIKNPSEELCWQAVKYNALNLKYVKNQTEELCILAVQIHGLCLEYVLEQTEKICLTACRANGNALFYVKNKTEEICLTALSNFREEQFNPICKPIISIIPIEQLTYEMCLISSKIHREALEYIPEKFRTDEILKNCVKYGWPLTVIKQTSELCMEAVLAYCGNFRYVNEEFKTEELCLQAASQKGVGFTILPYIREDKQTEKIQMLALENHTDSFKYIKNPSDEIIKLAIQKIPFNIQYVENQTEELCMLAINLNTYSIGFIKNPTFKIYQFACSLNYQILNLVPDIYHNTDLYRVALPNYASLAYYSEKNAFLSLCKKQTYEICEEAIKIYAYNIRYVKEPTADLCLLACEVGDGILQYIPEKFRTYELCLKSIIKNHNDIVYVPPNILDRYMCMESFKQSHSLRYIPEKFRTYEMCLLACQTSDDELQYVNEEFRTDEICMLAIKKDPCGLKHIFRQTEELCLEAVKKNPLSFKYVLRQTEEICMLACSKNGYYLKYVRNQSLDVCLAAVRQNPESIKYIRDLNMVKYITNLSNV